MASRVLQELKRRKVVQVGIVYAVVGFGVTQVADVMLPNLGLPAWTVTLVVALVLLGFPLALVLSWILGDPERALSLMDRAWERTGSPLALYGRARVLRVMGRDADLAKLATQVSRTNAVGEGATKRWVGDVEGALDALERAYKQRLINLPLSLSRVGSQSVWRPVYDHPRFQAVFQKVFPGRELPTA